MRRWAKGLAIGFGVLALFAVWMIAGAVWITARPADPMLWPPRQDAPGVDIIIVSNGYHAGVTLPRAALAELAGSRGYPALIAVTQRFAAYDWLEFGWGEREFYRAVPTVGDLTLGLALRALFRPGNESVLHVVGVNDAVQAYVSAQRVRVPLSRKRPGLAGRCVTSTASRPAAQPTRSRAFSARR